MGRSAKVTENERARNQRELDGLLARDKELDGLFERLYEDSVTGRISDERFTELSADYEAEQKELKEKAAALQSELSKTLEATANAASHVCSFLLGFLVTIICVGNKTVSHT